MESIKEIFKIGLGPSSSHTMGPRKAAELFLYRNSQAHRFEATLYGSLAATGKGHLTDKAIEDVFSGKTLLINWKPEEVLERHPNALKFVSFDQKDQIIEDWIVYSVGGGEIRDDAGKLEVRNKTKIYQHSTLNDILDWCEADGKSLWEYVEEHEDDTLWPYLAQVWEVMQDSIKRGLDTEGVLPGSVRLARKASTYYIKAQSYYDTLKRRSLVFAYALAVAEENAAGGEIVTAPTCGSCGVIPGVLYLYKMQHNFSDKKILRALATAGLIGNLIKENASLSGAEVGCQGEIGSACAMASAASIQLFGGTPFQIEYAAEMGLEHHLGLTCDPVDGLVQIPCIERNAFAAARAIDSNVYSMLSDGKHRVSFDKTVKVMNQTGHDLPSLYKETSMGGLAIYAKSCRK
ncbi:MAG: L-serine ammonia-lyase [Bacteroidales bacterium]|nr:L-serine ammonia-lyase [Bacteroidales bacterium]